MLEKFIVEALQRAHLKLECGLRVTKGFSTGNGEGKNSAAEGAQRQGISCFIGTGASTRLF
jgi:hypothetical protein